MSKRSKLYKSIGLGKMGTKGVSFQFPPYWDDGSGKVKHVPHGPLKGRVYFESKQEARDIARRHEDKSGIVTRYE